MKIETKFFPHYTRYKRRIKEAPIKGLPKRIIIISDTHITDGSIFNESIFRRGIEEIQKIKNVDYIIHLGDLTQNGTYLDYEQALEHIKPINNEKFLIIPGNHDAKNVGYLLFEELLGARTFVAEDNDLFILGIDSSIPDQNSGRIGIRNIKKYKDIFFGYPDKVKIFCFHHQLIPIPLTGRERSAIFDGGDALEMILDTNVDIILNGHRHISNIYSCTDGDGETIIFNSGTLSCNKTRYRELFTYSILDVFDKAITLQTKKIMTGEKIKRGRYINRIFNPNPSHKEFKKILSIVHIANTHFSMNNFNEEIYDEAVKQINALKADLVIHTGDVTNSNLYEEFEMAYHYLNKILHPKIIIPGDNDLMTIGWEIFPKIIGPTEPIYEDEKVRVIGINSSDKAIESGNVGRKRVRETIEVFREAPEGKINIVALYHNLVPHPNTRFDSILSDSGNVLKSFTELENNINLILTGHDHIAFTLQVEDTVLSSCGTVSSRDYLTLAGNTYNIIDCYENGFVQISAVLVQTGYTQPIGEYWISNGMI